MQKGLIINNISNLYYVEVDGKVYECAARGKMKQEEAIPTVGDYVQIDVTDEKTEAKSLSFAQIEDKKGIICDVLGRKTYIKRPKLANLTQIIFIVSLKMPGPDLLLLDKQLAYAKLNNIKPIICINKIDLVKKEEIDNIMKLYKSIGYTVLTTNAKGKVGTEKLKEILKDNITAFSGNSGVGKSTLINAIFEEELTEEGFISKKNKKGKNTTTNVTLYKIDENTYIADTPGFSTFDLTELESNNLDEYFIEFIPHIDECEYIGCNHIKEQECGIKKALEENKISKERYDRYCKIYQDLKEKEERKWK